MISSPACPGIFAMDFMEIFTLVTGVIYIILEIRQKNFMWVVGVFTSLAAMWVFFRQGLYASFGLNTYYLITAFIGLWQWGQDKKKLSSSETVSGGDVIHLNRLPMRTLIVSLLVCIAGTFALAWVMQLMENPMSYLDSAVAVLSAVATWWLVRSYSPMVDMDSCGYLEHRTLCDPGNVVDDCALCCICSFCGLRLHPLEEAR